MFLVKKKMAFFFLFILSFLSMSGVAYAWNHEIAIGYGAGREIEQHYYNQGMVLSGKFYKFPNIDETLIATLDGTLASIHASTKDHNHLVTAAIALAFRAYFFDPAVVRMVRPYIQASFGPAYLSVKRLGNRSQGSHVAFQTSLETGTEWAQGQHQWDFNLRLIHYCNAGIFRPNQGINLMPVLSIGYLF